MKNENYYEKTRKNLEDNIIPTMKPLDKNQTPYDFSVIGCFL